jgi:ComF family protein
MQWQKYYLDWYGSMEAFMFPRLCCGCENTLNKNEEVLCTACVYRLPRTHFHNLLENPVSQKFWGRIPLAGATSFLFFQKGGAVRELLHTVKYQGRQDIGERLGRLFGQDLVQSPRFATELIIPLPLHPDKLRVRGYNQCDPIVRGMAQSMGCSYTTEAVRRTVANPTQTRKTRMERWQNVASIFEVHQPEWVQGKAVMLVDDVVTTGATLEACGRTLLEAGARSLHIATLATA